MRLLAAALLALSGLALGPAPARAQAGDLIVWLRNQDFEGERTGFEASWLAPWTEHLKVEAGGAYQNQEDVGWGYAIAGAWYSFRDTPYAASARLRQGAGDGPGGGFNYTDARAGLTRGFFGHRASLTGEFQLIRVDRAQYNLGRAGLALVLHPRAVLNLGYFHHIAGDETNGVTTRLDLQTPVGSLIGGYAWSSADTQVLLGSAGQETHEYYFGATYPLGRHSLSLIGSRAHTEGDTRSSLDLVWRWSLPESFGRGAPGD